MRIRLIQDAINAEGPESQAKLLAKRMLKPSRQEKISKDGSFEASDSTAKELIDAGFATPAEAA